MTGLSFDTLILHLHMRDREEEQARILNHWLEHAADSESAPCLDLLFGRLPAFRVSVPSLKAALFERLDEALFEASRDTGTDLSETLSLLWPGGSAPFNVHDITSALQISDKGLRLEKIVLLLDQIDATARELTFRIATGRFKPPVSQSVTRTVLSRNYNVPLWRIAEGLANSEDAAIFLTRLSDRVASHATDRPQFLSIPCVDEISNTVHSNDVEIIALPDGQLVEWLLGKNLSRLLTLEGDFLSKGPSLIDINATILAFRPNRKNEPLTLLDLMAIDGVDVRPRSREERYQKLVESVGSLKSENAVLASSISGSTQAAFDEQRIQSLICFGAEDTLLPDGGRISKINRPARHFILPILYVEGRLSRKGHFDGEVTLGAFTSNLEGSNRSGIVPVGKASAESLEDSDRRRLSQYIEANTLERFGPVRKLKAVEEAALVASLNCTRITPAPRRKAGLVLEDNNLLSISQISSVPRTTTLDELAALALL